MKSLNVYLNRTLEKNYKGDMVLAKKFLEIIDSRLYEFLIKNANIMPMRFVKYIALFYTDARVRKIYLKRLGVKMGQNTYANIGFRIVSNDYKMRVIIGDNVSIAPNVVLIACSSANNGKKINEIAYVKKHLWKEGKIVIENDVWIGANVTILPGVRVGECAVVGAGSVVTKDVEPYAIVAGNPARVLQRLKERE